MAVLKKLRAKAGSYTDKSGNEKTRYITIGVRLETKNGEALKIDNLPLNWDGWVYEVDPEDQVESKPAKRVADMVDDVPF